MKQLCVLLSAYNGTKYIIEQLNSIFKQSVTDCHIRVFLRDDGSNDGTIKMCEEYAQKNKYAIDIVAGENVGPARSFMKLINECPDADYYAFCDQDDIWLPGKVQAATDALSDDKAALWLSNYDVVNEDLSIQLNSALAKPETNPLRVIFYNNVPGCVMVLNRQLMIMLKSLEMDDIRMHDIFALSTAAMLGKVIYNPNSYVLYRQHDSNVLGYGHKKYSIIKSIKGKIKWLRSPEDYHIPEFAKKLLALYEPQIDNQTKEGLKEISTYKDRIFNTIRLLTRDYTKNRFGRTTVSIRSKILFHMF